MAKILIHIHSGPGNPTKATLGCLVGLTAVREGHDVTFFFAGDGVHLLAPDHIAAVEGVGTGKLSDHMAGLKKANARFYASGMSAKARGYDASLLEGVNAEFAMPDRLVALAAEAGSVLCY